MNKNFALYLLKTIKDYEKKDYNDVLHYVELLLANEEEVTKLLNLENWSVSTKYNSKTVFKGDTYIGFYALELNENDVKEEVKCLNLYLIDGNENRRIIKKVDNDYNEVKYTHRTIEEVSTKIEEIREKCKKVLPSNENYRSTRLKKSDLVDYSEKCYKVERPYIFIPKSVVAFDEEENVVVIEWFFNKNKILLG